MRRAVEWMPSALADVARQDVKTQARIFKAVERFAEMGYGDVEKLKGHEDEYRLRVGRWRIRFTYRPATRAIAVLRVFAQGQRIPGLTSGKHCQSGRF